MKEIGQRPAGAPDGGSTGHGVQIRALICALEEERGHMILALYDLEKDDLEALMEAAQLIDAEAQDILEAYDVAL